MSRPPPRILLTPEFTELLWAIKPRIEEWAEVISYDPPGIGTEPLPAGITDLSQLSRDMVAERGLERVEAAGWESFFIVAEGWGIGHAARIAARRSDAVAGLVLGHAKLSFAREGERAPINADVYDAFTQLLRQDAREFVRYAISQVTKGGVDEEHAKRLIDRIPPEFNVQSWLAFTKDEPFADDLGALECPILLAKHEGCLVSTDVGFEDVVTALPDAETIAVEDPPATSTHFAEALHRFCMENA